MSDQFRLPTTEDRTIIIGQTGSGKTVGGLWHLSLMPIDEMPALIIDFKREPLISEIPYAETISIGQPLPPVGVSIVQPMPIKDDLDQMEVYLRNILDAGNSIIFVDEGFMLKDSEAFNTILMQGRAKRVSVIICTQRPVWISRFAFTESQYVQVFFVGDERDQQTISAFTPLYRRNRVTPRLQRYWSWWYDVRNDQLVRLKPVPGIGSIMHRFETKLKPPEPMEPQKVSRRVYI